MKNLRGNYTVNLHRSNYTMNNKGLKSIFLSNVKLYFKFFHKIYEIYVIIFERSLLLKSINNNTLFFVFKDEKKM